MDKYYVVRYVHVKCFYSMSKSFDRGGVKPNKKPASYKSAGA